MSPSRIVIIKIASMFLVMAVGWLARRRGRVDDATVSLLSRLTTDIALPALIFVQMLDTVNARVLRDSWAMPLVAVAILALGHLVGWSVWRLFATRRQAPAFIFAVMMCNWIYLPLPIVQDLYPVEGVRQLLLSNAGVYIYLWTAGVATLHQGHLERGTFKNLLKNPNLLATVAGILCALWIGSAAPAAPSLLRLPVAAVLEALRAVGSLTIPLSLLVIGGQLGAIQLTRRAPRRALAGVVLLRLVVVPLLLLGMAALAQAAGWRLPHTSFMVAVLISAMPVAVSCSLLVDRYGQDTALAAQSILYTTLLSILTVPLIVLLAAWLG